MFQIEGRSRSPEESGLEGGTKPRPIHIHPPTRGVSSIQKNDWEERDELYEN